MTSIEAPSLSGDMPQGDEKYPDDPTTFTEVGESLVVGERHNYVAEHHRQELASAVAKSDIVVVESLAAIHNNPSGAMALTINAAHESNIQVVGLDQLLGFDTQEGKHRSIADSLDLPPDVAERVAIANYLYNAAEFAEYIHKKPPNEVYELIIKRVQTAPPALREALSIVLAAKTPDEKDRWFVVGREATGHLMQRVSDVYYGQIVGNAAEEMEEVLGRKPRMTIVVGANHSAAMARALKHGSSRQGDFDRQKANLREIAKDVADEVDKLPRVEFS